jgi:DNA-binding transcriptional ArsR family regulator
MSYDGADVGVEALVAPDYELADEIIADRPEQLKALGERTRLAILDLVLDRAATVTELSVALSKPKGTVAHHVEVLLRVVRTRQVRALTESFYGRTGRTIHVTVPLTPEHPMGGMLAEALNEQIPHVEGCGGGFTRRHARITTEQADAFAERVAELAAEFTTLPRGGTVVFGFVAGVYPTAPGVLPAREEP